MAMEEERIRIEVAYARPDVQVVIALRLRPPVTVRAAIQASGVLRRFPEVDLSSNRVGIHGSLVALGQELQAGDRVEIYRPLVRDPKTQRRLRAGQADPRR